MKLLLDENLSRRLLAPLAQAYPGSSHVVTEGLHQASDGEVWEFARARDFAIIESRFSEPDVAMVELIRDAA